MTPCWQNLMLIPGEYDSEKWMGGTIGQRSDSLSESTLEKWGRIVSSKEKGESTRAVAAREGLSVSHVRRIYRRWLLNGRSW